MALVKLATVAEVPEGGMIAKPHEKRQVLLAKIEGKIYAMDNVCNHAGAELHEGQLGEQAPFLVTCPWHDAHFDVRDGKVHQDTDWARDMDSFAVEIREDEVWVDL